MDNDKQKLIIITAPSGSGKTTIVNLLLKHFPQLTFSISACTRAPRAGEVNGVQYYFISTDEFIEKIKNQEFAEYEMVYEGKYYGTLKSELQAIWNTEKFPLVDIDVFGAMRIKKYYQQNALSIFIKAPSIEELEKRLKNRGTDTEQSIQERIAKANNELSYIHHFDKIVVNDVLHTAVDECANYIKEFLNQ
ncbi:MAG: guanylate kinase [Chitinophagaceae bacterium]|nr:MAG: guanylate kinase [Bacteroidetes bacterium OLB11]MCC6448260.1 guanylate kinase [Chitinophagaceae bacterium]HMN33196.1 guanylate kinase [Chitinophagaceae bacterium]